MGKELFKYFFDNILSNEEKIKSLKIYLKIILLKIIIK